MAPSLKTPTLGVVYTLKYGRSFIFQESSSRRLVSAEGGSAEGGPCRRQGPEDSCIVIALALLADILDFKTENLVSAEDRSC